MHATEPTNLGFRITELWAFIADAGDGDEGLIGMTMGLTWVPFVCADRERMESLKPMARKIARSSGQTVRLVHFGGERTEIEVYDPDA